MVIYISYNSKRILIFLEVYSNLSCCENTSKKNPFISEAVSDMKKMTQKCIIIDKSILIYIPLTSQMIPSIQKQLH